MVKRTIKCCAQYPTLPWLEIECEVELEEWPADHDVLMALMPVRDAIQLAYLDAFEQHFLRLADAGVMNVGNAEIDGKRLKPKTPTTSAPGSRSGRLN